MKKGLLLIISILLLCPCMAQHRLKDKDLMDMNPETFDFDNYRKNEQGFIYHLETRKDGTNIQIANDQYDNISVQIHKPPYYFTQIKEFNKDGKLIRKGIILGNPCPVEKWLECDENGENCKTVDYEEGRGKFSYQDVLKFLEKKKFIDKKVKNIEDERYFDLEYSYEQKIWKINASHKNSSMGYYAYELDGDSGKILKEEYISTIY